MIASNEALNSVRTFHAVTAWICLVGIAVAAFSTTVILHAI